MSVDKSEVRAKEEKQFALNEAAKLIEKRKEIFLGFC